MMGGNIRPVMIWKVKQFFRLYAITTNCRHRMEFSIIDDVVLSYTSQYKDEFPFLTAKLTVCKKVSYTLETWFLTFHSGVSMKNPVQHCSKRAWQVFVPRNSSHLQSCAREIREEESDFDSQGLFIFLMNKTLFAECHAQLYEQGMPECKVVDELDAAPFTIKRCVF